MSEKDRDSARARDEAAGWFARLGRASVTTQSLREFRAWRQAPANQSAYARLDQTWRAAGDLADDPEIRAATQAAFARRSLRARLADLVARHTRWAWALGSAVAAAAVVALVAPSLLQPTYATGVGEQRLVVLKDGSRVRLNTDSRIAVRFDAGERHVALTRGEAFFEVAHDPRHPFIVEADGASVRALGTRFDVRRQAAAVQVTLVEGAVRVRERQHGSAWTLAPNQQLTVSSRGGAVMTPADTARVTSWTGGRLIFHDTPLAAAVAEVNRYSAHKIALKADRLASAPVDGVFDTGDTQAFVAAVTTLFDLKAVRQADGSTVLSSRAG